MKMISRHECRSSSSLFYFCFLKNNWKVHSRGVYVKFLEILHKALLRILVRQFFIEICGCKFAAQGLASHPATDWLLGVAGFRRRV